MRQVGVYFESWSANWATKSEDHTLARIPESINTVYLSFVDPSCNYVHGQRNWNGTGLDFSSSFDVVHGAIRILKARGVKVFLAVGGASYWGTKKVFSYHGCVELMNDLSCDGIDLDWEVGVTDDSSPVSVIKNLRPLMPLPKLISFTCFSTGAYPKFAGDNWRGMNLQAISKCAGLIDQVNVMAYDAGANFDARAAFSSFRNYYSGRINMGFEVGVQGWGTGLLEEAEAMTSLKFVSQESSNGGCFVWAYFKNDSVGVTGDKLVNLASDVFSLTEPPKKKPTFSTPSSWFVMCPTCQQKIKLAVSAEPK
jgi:hypothetical protein